MKRRFASRVPATKSPRASAAGPKAISAAPAMKAAKSLPAVGTPRFAAAPASVPARKPDLARQPHVVREALKQPGQPLDARTRGALESRFQRDLTDVRVHTTPTATRSAAALRAEAYTLGSHIVFNAGRYSPNSPDGRRLLAHEVTHVVQQTQPGAATTSPAALETQADRGAAAALTPGATVTTSPAAVGVQCRKINPNQSTQPAAGDYMVVDIGGPNWWFVFYDQGFKVVKKIFHEGRDTNQIGPNWVCNNPGNMTFDVAKIGDKAHPNLAVISKICRDHGVYGDAFTETGIPLAIFPTIDKGRDALMAWFGALLTPTHKYWTELGISRKATSILGAVSEHAPKGHGKNNPADYAQIVADSINAGRSAAGGSRGKISATGTATIAPEGTGAQDISSADMEAWSEGSEKAEGGTLAGFSWQVNVGDAFPADLATKIGKTGGAPAALVAWCDANKVALPASAGRKTK